MTINTNGRINVTTPGTPVPLTTNHKLVANKLFFQVIPGLTGKTYVGIPSMSKSSLSGVARVLSANASGGFSETFSIEGQDGEEFYSRRRLRHRCRCGGRRSARYVLDGVASRLEGGR